jgi:hypothetical protein
MEEEKSKRSSLNWSSLNSDSRAKEEREAALGFPNGSSSADDLNKDPV